MSDVGQGGNAALSSDGHGASIESHEPGHAWLKGWWCLGSAVQAESTRRWKIMRRREGAGWESGARGLRNLYWMSLTGTVPTELGELTAMTEL